MSVLAIDIGNSRVGLGVFTRGKAQDPAVRLAHGELDLQLVGTLKTLWEAAVKQTEMNDDDETGVVIASVVPALTERMEQLVETQLKVKAKRISRQGMDARESLGDIQVPLKTLLTDEKTVGLDRLLGALAAYVNVEKACAIVHVGTALVVDCIDDEGVFRGGAISPGLQMGAKALHEWTAQLPNVALTPPEETVPFGRFTLEAINMGLYVGMRGAVRELVERYALALGSWPHVVATGGDAQGVLGELQIVDSFVPDLVLQGAALAWEAQREK